MSTPNENATPSVNVCRSNACGYCELPGHTSAACPGRAVQPAGNHFTEAAIRRSAYLDAANICADDGPNTCGCLGCAECALYQAAQQLRRRAKHYTTAEQPTGLTWEARADHAIRLYATTAIERDDARAENARLRARVTELETDTEALQRDKQAVAGVAERARNRLGRIAEAHSKDSGPGGLTSGDCDECGHAWPCPTYTWATTDRDPLATWDPADDEESGLQGITPVVVYVDEVQLGTVPDVPEPCAQHPSAPRIGDMCGGCTQYPTDMTETPEATVRRYARRLHAVEQLVAGRPGYHTVTAKELLTAMSDADEEASG